MTELTRLFDLVRDIESRLAMERRSSDGVWRGCLTVWLDGSWHTFITQQPTPEAVVADLVLQLADWQSRQGDWDAPVPGAPDFPAKMEAAEAKLRELDKEERSRGNRRQAGSVQADVKWDSQSG